MPDYKIQFLVLDRCNLDANMARFYVLSIETSLFGDAALSASGAAVSALRDNARSNCTKARAERSKLLRPDCAASRGGATSHGTAPPK